MEQVKSVQINGSFAIALSGHITSANAAEVENAVMALVDQNTGENLVLDARELEFISSAGLRIILRLLKGKHNPKLVNVSSDVYEVLDTTGFTEMMTVEKAYRQVSIDGCEVIGAGSNGIVYRLDAETIVKTYRDPNALPEMHREREIARRAFILGIPTAIPYDIVQVDDKYGAVFELLNAMSISKLVAADESNIDHYMDIFVDLLKQIHDTPVRPGEFADARAVALKWADDLKGVLPDDLQQKLHDMIAAVPLRHNMIHGDYHTNNVMIQNGEALLIDMDTISEGHPVFELASTFNGFVGFGEANPNAVKDFLRVEYATTCRMWQMCLERYLGTDDAEKIRSVAEKAMVVGYTRLLRRALRREKDTEVGKKRIELSKQHLLELLGRVDSLDF